MIKRFHPYLIIFVLFVTLDRELNAQTAKPVTIEKVASVKPINVIFILSDDHRYDFMGFTGKVPGLQHQTLID